LVTNGGLLDAKKSEIIVNNCSYVRVSLDAGSNETHRKLHLPKNPKKDNFNRIIDNIKTLVKLRRKNKSNITIGIGFLVHSINYKEIYKTAELVKNIGVDYIQIRPSFIPGEQLSDKIMFEVENQMQKAIKLSNSDFHVFPILHRFDEVKNLDKGYNKCYGHALVGVISANGNLYLCCQLRGFNKFCFGNIMKESFHSIWYGKERQKVISKINLDECLPCRYNKYNEILDYLADTERPHKNFL
jgi:radical SAM protein with 4Fe4S-binding SPASM domain